MRLRSLIGSLWVLCSVLVATTAGASNQSFVLDIKGTIGPATSDYVHTGFIRAHEHGAAMIVLRVDTPGGLDAAMRDIVKEILASRLPVVGYVAPSGARAASAGTYILQACHIAAMAPATTLGSATPVRVGALPRIPDTSPEPDSPPSSDNEPATDDKDQTSADSTEAGARQPASTMERKLINDAAAYLRGLATLRGRNAEWAESAVRTADNLAAAEAQAQGVIDVVATDLPDLLKQIDGRVISVLGDEVTLDTTGLTSVELKPDWRIQLLHIITDPNVAYVLLLIGIYGLIYELANPGALVPGVSGAIALIIALYAFQALPVSFAGLALLALGIVLMTLEAFVPSFGVLGIGGAIAFVAGSVMLFRDDAGQIGVALPVIATFAILSIGVFVGVIGYAVKTRRNPVVSGAEELIGAVGVALEDFDGQGRIRIHSESWPARSNYPVKSGQRVRVVSMDGLTLNIEEVQHD